MQLRVHKQNVESAELSAIVKRTSILSGQIKDRNNRTTALIVTPENSSNDSNQAVIKLQNCSIRHPEKSRVFHHRIALIQKKKKENSKTQQRSYHTDVHLRRTSVQYLETQRGIDANFNKHEEHDYETFPSLNQNVKNLGIAHH